MRIVIVQGMKLGTVVNNIGQVKSGTSRSEVDVKLMCDGNDC